MILSDQTLRKMLKEQTLRIDPLTPEQIQPASIDIRLGNSFRVVEDSPAGMIDMENEIRYKAITADTYILLPNQFVLATTMEYFHLPDHLTALISSIIGRRISSAMPGTSIISAGGPASSSAAILNPEFINPITIWVSV